MAPRRLHRLWRQTRGAAIGNQSSTGDGHVNPFDGQIAEVRLWDAVRTQSEIDGYKDIPLSAGEVANGLAGYWPLNDGSGTTAAAVVGVDGTVQDGASAHGTPPWVTVEHPTPVLLGANVRTAMDFDGAADHVVLGQEAAFEVDTTFTIEGGSIPTVTKGGTRSCPTAGIRVRRKVVTRSV